MDDYTNLIEYVRRGLDADRRKRGEDPITDEYLVNYLMAIRAWPVANYAAGKVVRTDNNE